MCYITAAIKVHHCPILHSNPPPSPSPKDFLIRFLWSKVMGCKHSQRFLFIVPAKPKNVRMTRVIKFIARVAWDRPQTTPTGIPDTSGLSYQFSYQKLGSLAKQLKTTTNAFSLRLTPNSKYAFKVRAYKSFDFYGPWSDTLNYTSKEGGEFQKTFLVFFP